MKRRTLILGALGAGGALIVGWSLLPPRSRLGAVFAPGGDAPVQLNGWVKVYADGTVGVMVPRAEMGQGVFTALPMLVAEEMDLPLARVRVEPAPIDAIYGNIAMLAGSLPFHPDFEESRTARAARWIVSKIGRELGLQVTGGSSSVRDAWLPMRQAGAVARALLFAAAARRWNVPVEQCRMMNGEVVHADGRKLGLGELAQDAARQTPPSTIGLRPVSQFKLLGTAAPRLDVPAKVDGSAQFGIDVRAPGLLYAAVKLCPVLGGSIGSINSDAVRARPGVLRVSAFAGGAGAAPGVAVVARDSWTAAEAVKNLDVRWNEGPHAALDGAALMTAMRTGLKSFDGFSFHSRGDGAEALKRAAVTLDAEYSAPWLAHATLEPMNCTAQFTADGRLRIWAPTQVASIARHVAARITGLEAERVEVNVTLLGGGFGRRLETDFIAVAVQVARDVAPAPVQVLWPREEDFTHDMYRPAAVARMKAGLDAAGKPLVWVTHSVSDAITPQYTARAYPAFAADSPDKTTAEGLFDQPYEFAHRASAHRVFKTPVPVGYWRAVGHSHNAFFTESFIDELAATAKRDPFEFRRNLLQNHPRHRAVLQLAAEKAGWGTSLPTGRARGIALHESFGSIVAQVAEVSIADKTPRVHRVVCAIDCGAVVNPNIVAQQMESGIVFGLTAALFGEITIERGRVMQTSFADYPMLLLRDSPVIETHIVPSEHAPGGVGEPGLPPIAPAVGNALFALTGQRLRDLPLRRT